MQYKTTADVLQSQQDAILRQLLDRISEISPPSTTTPFKPNTLPAGIRRKLYNTLSKENPNWSLSKTSTEKRLLYLYKQAYSNKKPLEKDLSETSPLSCKNTHIPTFLERLTTSTFEDSSIPENSQNKTLKKPKKYKKTSSKTPSKTPKKSISRINTKKSPSSCTISLFDQNESKVPSSSCLSPNDQLDIFHNSVDIAHDSVVFQE